MKILVIRLSSLGDIVLTTPVLKAMKVKYPEIKLDFLVLDKFQDAIKGCLYVDQLKVFDKKKNKSIKDIYKFSKELKKENYDYVI
ncbi:MAG: glycosyltransferase family 9 protein, partial [Fusobacteriaceae bacterium]